MRTYLRVLTVLGLFLIGIVGSTSAAPITKDEKPAEPVRKLTSSAKIESRGALTDPVVLKTEGDVRTAIKDEEAAKELMKQVDLKKETIVYFAWAGSGQDKLAFRLEDADKGKKVVFTYTRGLTRDLRRHLHFFAVPAGSMIEVKTMP